jgi:hypothetical protein
LELLSTCEYVVSALLSVEYISAEAGKKEFVAKNTLGSEVWAVKAWLS